MTKQHRKALNLYIKFAIRDTLNTIELKKLKKFINEQLQERDEWFKEWQIK